MHKTDYLSTFFPNHLLCLMLSAFLLAACEKGMLPEEEPGMSNGHSTAFKLKMPEDMTSTEHELRFTLAVPYGNTIYEIQRKRSDPDFENASMKLEKGKYHALVLVHYAEKPISFNVKDYPKIVFPDRLATDCFWCNQEFEVNDEQQSVQLDVKRIAARIDLKSTGILTENLSAVNVYFTGGSSTIDISNGSGAVNSRQSVDFNISPEMKGKKGAFTIYTIPRTNSPTLKITVKGMDKQGNVLFNTVLENVPIQANHTTNAVFDNGNNTGGDDKDDENPDQDTNIDFDININNEWDTPINYAQ